MRTSKIKNKLNDELEALAPERRVAKKERTIMARFTNSKKIGLIAASLVLIVALSVGGVMLFGNSGKTVQAESYVMLDINPSVEFSLDKKNKVVAFSAGNADGEVILYALSKEGIDLTGQTIETATENVVRLAIKYGYVEDGSAELNVTIEGSGKTEKIDTTIRNLIEKGVNKVKGNIDIAVTSAAEYLLEHELAVLKENNLDNADYQSLTTSKLRLIKSVRMADRRLSMDNAVKMPIDELTKLAEANQKKASDKLTAACDLAIMAANFTMDNVLGVWYDEAYLKAIRETGNLVDIRYINAIAYMSVNPILRGIEQIESLINAYNANPIFTQDDVFNLLNAVGVTNIDEKYATLMADMTKYTDMSLQNLQKYIKDLSIQLKKVAADSEQYKNIELKLRFALSVNDEIVKDSEKIISISGKDNITEIQEKLIKLAEKLDSLIIPQNTEELKGMTIASFDNLVKQAIELRAKMFDDINLTDAEIKRADEIIADRKADVIAAKESFNTAVTKAKRDAMAVLDKILDTRLVIDIK